MKTLKIEILDEAKKEHLIHIIGSIGDNFFRCYLPEEMPFSQVVECMRERVLYSTKLRNFGRSVEIACQKSAAHLTAFAKLGISLDDLQTKGANELFGMVASAMFKIKDPTQVAAIEKEIFRT